LAAMRHLTELRLKEISGIDALISCLHAAPALRLLELDLEAQHPNVIRSASATHPAADILRALLSRAPQLQVRVLLAPTLAEWLERACRRHMNILSLQAQFAEQWR